MKVIFNITENKNKATFQQEVVKINTSFNQTQNIVKPKFQTGYYPLPVNLGNYYTKNETDNLFLNYYTKLEVDDIIDNIPTVDLSNYYTKTETYSKTEINNFVSNLELEINNKANSGDVYLKTQTYSKTQIDTFLSGKQNTISYTPENSANKSDSYTVSSPTTYASTKALVDGLATKLDKGTYEGTAQDLYTRFEGKITASTNNIPRVGNGASGKVMEDSKIVQINGKIGIELPGEASEKLEVGGNIKAISYKFNLPISITAQPNMLIPKPDGSRPTWYNSSSEGKDIAFIDDISGGLVNRKIVTENQVLIPSAVNYATSQITVTNHGKTIGSVTFCGIFLNQLSYMNGGFVYIPFEWRLAKTYIKAIDANTLQICNNAGTAIAVNTADSKNSSIDFTKWHLELFGKLTINVPNLSRFRFVVKGYCVASSISGNRSFSIINSGTAITEFSLPSISDIQNSCYNNIDVYIDVKDGFPSFIGTDNYYYHNNAFGTFASPRNVNIMGRFSSYSEVTSIECSMLGGSFNNFFANGTIIEIYKS